MLYKMKKVFIIRLSASKCQDRVGLHKIDSNCYWRTLNARSISFLAPFWCRANNFFLSFCGLKLSFYKYIEIKFIWEIIIHIVFSTINCVIDYRSLLAFEEHHWRHEIRLTRWYRCLNAATPKNVRQIHKSWCSIDLKGRTLASDVFNLRCVSDLTVPELRCTNLLGLEAMLEFSWCSWTRILKPFPLRILTDHSNWRPMARSGSIRVLSVEGLEGANSAEGNAWPITTS